MDVTVVIKTLCRESLVDALQSALREKLPVIVASDGYPFPDNLTELLCHPLVSSCQLGRHYGQYGSMAFNVGAMLASTTYVAMLDDDDEFVVGAGQLIYNKIKADPTVDIWIPGLRYSSGKTVCLRHGVYAGNVACPILKTDVLTTTPLLHIKKSDGFEDFYHIQRCQADGYKIAWIGETCILVRPKLPNDNGRGQK